MPLNRALVGRRYVAPEPFEVGREHIRSFALAIGDPNPVYLDPAAARALGHRDVVAPPTFLTVLALRFGANGPVVDSELGLDYALVVHGEQTFTHHRPIHPGDRLSGVTTITGIRDAGRNELMTMATEVTDEAGAAVATLVSTIVSRGTATGQEG